MIYFKLLMVRQANISANISLAGGNVVPVYWKQAGPIRPGPD
jgi:hypothetical protein